MMNKASSLAQLKAKMKQDNQYDNGAKRYAALLISFSVAGERTSALFLAIPPTIFALFVSIWLWLHY